MLKTVKNFKPGEIYHGILFGMSLFAISDANLSYKWRFVLVTIIDTSHLSGCFYNVNTIEYGKLVIEDECLLDEKSRI